MNISDGELMEGVLAARGYEIVDRAEEADVVLVNTCAVREHAERRVLGRVGQLSALKRERPDLVLCVTGCMAQRLGEKLLDGAGRVDLVMGPDGYRDLPEALQRLGAPATATTRPNNGANAGANGSEAAPPVQRGRGRRQLAVLDLSLGENYQGLEQRRKAGASAWIPIQRGCDHRCTFCIVPYVRGGEKNRDADEILTEVRGLAAGGVSDVTLLGQTVNSYRAGAWDFPRLLAAVARVDGIRRVWFTSPHPNDVTPELVAVMAEEPAVCEMLHLPAQSGSNRTLKRMLRRYTVEAYLEKVALVRDALADVALTTDLIVGFPGETDDEFRRTLELARTVRFHDAFTYKYSPREGTPATRLPAGDFLAPEVAQARLEELIAVTRGVQAEINEGEVGRVVEVLVEKEAKSEGHMLGRTRRNKVVVFPAPADLVGRYVQVVLERTTGATFVGSRVEDPVAAARA
jgi:tRNA-2-methylthio-N6-dimethylallyladenosine synthase